MATWTLILFVHAGAWSDKDSMALTHVPGFPTVEACRLAGETSKQLVTGTVKAARYVCVPMANQK